MRTHAAILVGQSLDAATFIAFFLLFPYAVAAERNPITATLLALGGIWLVGLVKVGLGGFVLWRFRSAGTIVRARPYRALAFVAAVSGFVGAAFNGWAILQALSPVSTT